MTNISPALSHHDCRVIDPDRVRDLAFRRSCAFATLAKVLEVLNTYFKENTDRSLVITRGPTCFQVGQAHCGGCNANHWATTSQPLTNHIDLIQERIKACGVTPKSKQILKAKNFSSPIINEIDSHKNDPQKMLKIFNAHLERRESRSVFANSRWEATHNGTIILPKAVNNFDSTLENKIRPFEMGLFSQISNEEINSEEATKLYVAKVKEICNTLKEKYSNTVEAIANFLDVEERIHRFQQNNKDEEELSNLQIDAYMNLIRELDGDRKTIGKISSLKKIIRERCRPYYALFLLQQEQTKAENKRNGFSYEAFSEVIFGKWERIGSWKLEEAENLSQHAENLLNVAILEEDATDVPDPLLLFGKYEEGERVALEEAELFDEVVQMISTIDMSELAKPKKTEERRGVKRTLSDKEKENKYSPPEKIRKAPTDSERPKVARILFGN
jgi:hypothetical protein